MLIQITGAPMQPGDSLDEEFSDYFLSQMNDSFSTAHMNYGSKVSQAYCEGLKGHCSIPSNELK